MLEAVAAVVGLTADQLVKSLIAVGGLALLAAVVGVAMQQGKNKDSLAANRALLKANKLIKKGQHEKAAQVFAEAGMWDHAADQYVKAGKLRAAVEAARKGTRKELLIAILQQAGEFKEAADLLEAMRKYDVAAAMLAKAGDIKAAAVMLEKGGLIEKAAAAHNQAGDPEQAGRLCAKIKKYDAAAKYLYDGYRASVVAKKPNMRLAVLASDALAKSGRKEAGLKLLIEAGRDKEIKEYAAQYKLETLGARLATDMGKTELAGYFISQGGDLTKAARVKAAGLRDSDPYGAAQLYVEAEEYEEAARLFEGSGHPDEAASMFLRAQMYSEALRLYESAGNSAAAARVLEITGQYNDAADRYAKAGNVDQAIACLEKAGDILAAARFALRFKNYDKAVALLSVIVASHAQFSEARILRGDALASLGRNEAAIDSYREGLEGAKVTDKNADAFYRMARLQQQTGKSPAALQVYKRIAAVLPDYKDVARRLQAAGAEAPAVQAPAPVSAPARGRYVMLGQIGRGGMGIVYKAQDTQLDRIVAYKVLPDDLRKHPEAVKNFLREARAAASLTHPNVVIVHDVGENDSAVFLVMEYLEGETLKDRIRRDKQLPVGAAVSIASSIAEGLGYAHEKKLVHRDIKPSNIMLTREGGVKIMDFGLAKVMREVGNNQTLVGGTPYYMSPEQVKGGAVSPASDFYALGCSMFEMLVGVVPFRDGDIGYHHVNTPPPAVKAQRTDVPDELSAIVQKLMQKDPLARYGAAAELLADLKPWRS